MTMRLEIPKQNPGKCWGGLRERLWASPGAGMDAQPYCLDIKAKVTNRRPEDVDCLVMHRPSSSQGCHGLENLWGFFKTDLSPSFHGRFVGGAEMTK